MYIVPNDFVLKGEEHIYVILIYILVYAKSDGLCNLSPSFSILKVKILSFKTFLWIATLTYKCCFSGLD